MRSRNLRLLLAHPHWPWLVSSFHPCRVLLNSTLSYPAPLSPTHSCPVSPHSITPFLPSLILPSKFAHLPSRSSAKQASTQAFFSLLSTFPSLLSPSHPLSIATHSNPGWGWCYLFFDPPRISFWVRQRWNCFKYVEPCCVNCRPY